MLVFERFSAFRAWLPKLLQKHNRSVEVERNRWMLSVAGSKAIQGPNFAVNLHEKRGKGYLERRVAIGLPAYSVFLCPLSNRLVAHAGEMHGRLDPDDF